jgi:hypothetical protein
MTVYTAVEEIAGTEVRGLEEMGDQVRSFAA